MLKLICPDPVNETGISMFETRMNKLSVFVCLLFDFELILSIKG